MRILGFIFRLVVRYFIEEAIGKVDNIKKEDIDKVADSVLITMANKAKTVREKKTKKVEPSADDITLGLTDGYNYY